MMKSCKKFFFNFAIGSPPIKNAQKEEEEEKLKLSRKESNKVYLF